MKSRRGSLRPAARHPFRDGRVEAAAATTRTVASGQVETDDRGHARLRARFVIMATGCLSVPLEAARSKGSRTSPAAPTTPSEWPHEGVDFSTGERVGVIGTGSSAIQAIPLIAEAGATTSTVFQRTPNFSVPAHNQMPSSPEYLAELQGEHTPTASKAAASRDSLSGFGDLEAVPVPKATGLPDRPPRGSTRSDEACSSALRSLSGRSAAPIFMRHDRRTPSCQPAHGERPWRRDFVHARRSSRRSVEDPKTAEALCPTSHPLGTKRICVDTDYYATYNRDNVRLVDLNRTPIERIEATGIRLSHAEVEADGTAVGPLIELDTLVLATGFDAMTGALDRIDLRGRNGQRLSDAWREGPGTYLGLMVAGFPNLFTITGPGSPSVLSNVVLSIEQHVDLIMDCLEEMTSRGASSVEPALEAQTGWVAHVNEVANATLMSKGGSWYMGANVPGKPRVFMPYGAGVGVYREICEGITKDGWRGFVFADELRGGTDRGE